MASDLRRFGPKPEGALLMTCSACQVQFKTGDYSTLIALGPGPDEEEQQKAREGRPYNAVAVEVHWFCATGESVDA